MNEIPDTPRWILEAKVRNGPVRRYRMEQPLGEGASGTVWLATWLPDEGSADDTRQVALKVSKNAMRWTGRLAKEAELIEKVEHGTKAIRRAGQGIGDRIVRLSGARKVLKTQSPPPERYVLELEYLDGQTLTEWLEAWKARSELTEHELVEQVCRFGLQLYEAVAQLQAVGVVHRDLKPDNVIVTSSGLRVFDLNVSGETDQTRYTSVGTPIYRAPEVELGQGHDQKADHYSLGVILFELVARRLLDPLHDCLGDLKDRALCWPPAEVAWLSDATRNELGDLLCGLVCGVDQRIRNIDVVRQRLEALRDRVIGRRDDQHIYAGIDMISLLAELRPSGLVSVVADTKDEPTRQSLQDRIRARMQVDDPLEGWLIQRMEDLLTEPGDDRPALLLLGGNAGDGKSHLIDRLLRKYLDDQPELKEQVLYIADATHAHSPDQDQRDRLRDFFRPFREGEKWDGRVRLIAMNTGMVINFFEREPEFHRLESLLHEQLGLTASPPTDGAPFRVEVVNLDLRNLVEGRNGQASFLERMLDRLRVDREGTVSADLWTDCEKCSAFGVCPVAFNLRALSMKAPRHALLGLMRRASLDAEVHLSPRNLWGFLYRMITGGLERYADNTRQVGEGPCDVVRRKAAEGEGLWLLQGQFTEALFHQAGGGLLFEALVQHDPAFSSAPHIDKLHTRLSIKSELDVEPEYVEGTLSGVGATLAGLSLVQVSSNLDQELRSIRRDAAVRRQFFFHTETYETWEKAEDVKAFTDVLEAYARYSNSPQDLTSAERQVLSNLNTRVQGVFLHGHGRRVGNRSFLQVSRPNVRSQSELLVEASEQALTSLFSVKEILAPDPHVRAHRHRRELLACLGYRPVNVQLTVAAVRLMVDLDLYDFLCRVEEGQKPSQRDLAQFQALVFVGERIGNQLARAMKGQGETLYVYDSEDSMLYRLKTNDWGDVAMSPVQVER